MQGCNIIRRDFMNIIRTKTKKDFMNDCFAREGMFIPAAV